LLRAHFGVLQTKGITSSGLARRMGMGVNRIGGKTRCSVEGPGQNLRKARKNGSSVGRGKMVNAKKSSEKGMERIDKHKARSGKHLTLMRHPVNTEKERSSLPGCPGKERRGTSIAARRGNGTERASFYNGKKRVRLCFQGERRPKNLSFQEAWQKKNRCSKKKGALQLGENFFCSGGGGGEGFAEVEGKGRGTRGREGKTLLG